MQVDVIGGSGFIGTRLMARLTQAAGLDARIVDKAPSKAFPQLHAFADVRSKEDLARTLRDTAVIVNLAAEHRDDVRPLSLYDEVNVDGAKHVCAVASDKGVSKIIFTSSVAVYGFAPLGTDESGDIKPFNDYGRTKYLAEQVLRQWQSEKPTERSVVIIRPTVVFGERNRGNVYNLLNQIASGRFLMVGDGSNRKSLAYVENVTAFIEHSLKAAPGVHVYNFIDKPDYTMNDLVGLVNGLLGRPKDIKFRLPYWVGFSIGKCFDMVSFLTGKKFTVSSIRVKKFCANSVYNTAIAKSGFQSPVPLTQGLERTIRYEFIEKNDGADVFYTE
jgi:GlcNAc-P-P-Und epimerase